MKFKKQNEPLSNNISYSKLFYDQTATIMRTRDPSFYANLSFYCQVYCLCDTKMFTNLDSLQIKPLDEFCATREEVKKTTRRVILSSYRFESKADILLRNLNSYEDSDAIIVHKRTKACSKAGDENDTRSEFIGVTKYRKHWQALITIRNRKIHIGSYKHEKDAAIAFDFYSILHYKLSAKTNFSYSKLDIVAMIYNFKLNDDIFKPEKLIINF